MKGFIYKLYGDEHDLVYYGSTIQKLSTRLAGHRREIFSGASSRYLFHTGEPVKITLVEIVDYEDKLELKQRENYYIKNFPCVNKNSACGVDIEKRKEHHKKYWAKNKDKIAERQAEYYLKKKEKYKLRESKRPVIYNDCECGGRYTNKNKSTHFKSKKHTKYMVNKDL